MFFALSKRHAPRSTLTSVAACTVSPSKQLAACIPARQQVHMKCRLRQAAQGRRATVKSITPAVDYHGYATADSGAASFYEKLQ